MNTHQQQLSDLATQLATLERQHPGRRLRVAVGIPTGWSAEIAAFELTRMLAHRGIRRLQFEVQPTGQICRILSYEFDA